ARHAAGDELLGLAPPAVCALSLHDALPISQQSDLSAVRTVRLGLVGAGSGDTADTLSQRMAQLNRGRELFLVLNNLLPGDPVERSEEHTSELQSREKIVWRLPLEDKTS